MVDEYLPKAVCSVLCRLVKQHKAGDQRGRCGGQRLNEYRDASVAEGASLPLLRTLRPFWPREDSYLSLPESIRWPVRTGMKAVGGAVYDELLLFVSSLPLSGYSKRAYPEMQILSPYSCGGF